MSGQGIKIEHVSIRSFKCFEEVELDCTREDSSVYQWTVLLGNNNTGKTSLLKAIAGMRPKETRTRTGRTFLFPAVMLDSFVFSSLRSSIHCRINNGSKYGRTAIEEYDGRTIGGIKNTSIRIAPTDHYHIIGYGVSRYPAKTSLTDSSCDDCDSLFYQDKYLINIEEWLMQLDYAAKSNNQAAAVRLEKVKALLCSELFPEILDFKFESSDKLHNYVLFQTEDGWFRYTQLGYGYQSMLSWVVDLCKRMFDYYPESPNPLNETAVVLVDEIDLHLHPKWQRDIISFLSKVFPNVQFIATTHSPLVIQSMDDVNLYVLHREGEGVKVERSSVTNFRGWTVEEILRDTMRLDNDVYSNDYQNYLKVFDEGLDEENRDKAQAAYQELIKMLHPENPARRLLEMQFSQLKAND